MWGEVEVAGPWKKVRERDKVLVTPSTPKIVERSGDWVWCRENFFFLLPCQKTREKLKKYIKWECGRDRDKMQIHKHAHHR